MALEENLQSFSYVANAAIDQYTILMLDPAVPRGCKKATAGATPLGTINNKTTGAGQAATTIRFGIAKVKSGGPIAIGAQVQSDGAGLGVTGGTGAAVLGTAITACAGANAIIEVQLAL